MALPYSMNSEQIKRLMDTALGEIKADMVVLGGDVVNVYAREIMPGYSIATKGERIAYVGKDVSHTIGPETKIIEAQGKTIIPGLIDAHTHILWLFNVAEFVKHALKTGTTTVITEGIEPVTVLGYSALLPYLKAFDNQPVKIFVTVPPAVTISPETGKYALSPQALRKFLKKDRVVGLGESYWLSVVKKEERVISLIVETLAIGKIAEGHTAGARNDKLISYLATGVSSCHEPITADEVIDRLRLGIYVMVREGAVRKDLSTIAKIKKEPIDFRRLILVSDGISPGALLKEGYMDQIVQKAIDLGFDPLIAIQMVTINAAEHFSLDTLVGGIAPGKLADIVIIPNLKTIRPELVISNGKIVAQNQKTLVPPQKIAFPRSFRQTIRLLRKLEPADFTILTQEKETPVTVRVINQVTDLVTREEQVTIVPRQSRLESDIRRDLIKVAVIDRFDGRGKMFTGFIKGFKMTKGAFASSATWDLPGIIVVGTNEGDMAQAVNRIFELQGGIVIYAEGKILAELPLPIGGGVSDLPMEAIVDKMAEIQQKARDLSMPFPDAHLTLTILTTAAIPFLRICESGLVDIRENKIVSLIITAPNLRCGDPDPKND